MLIAKYARFYKQKLTRGQFLRMLRTTSVSALDVEAIVTYNSFNDLVHYYSEMSAMGDRIAEFGLLDTYSNSSECVADEWGRIANTSIPFAVLQALDDPLVVSFSQSCVSFVCYMRISFMLASCI
jgi:predicted alpha/beta-fold hydrolase